MHCLLDGWVYVVRCGGEWGRRGCVWFVGKVMCVLNGNVVCIRMRYVGLKVIVENGFNE